MSQSKILWIDTETGGLDPKINPILELGCIVEINGKVRDKQIFRFRPFPDDEVDPAALRVNKLTMEDLEDYPWPKTTMNTLRGWLGTFADPYNQYDKFVMAGYNVHFDDSFLRRTFTNAGDKFYDSWFWWPKIDVQHLVAKEILRGVLRLKSFRLSAVCAAYGVQLSDAHSALADIQATRDLALKIGGI